MFRDYFIPGFAIVLLGILSFPSPPAQTPNNGSSTDQKKKVDNPPVPYNQIKTGVAPTVPKIDEDKALWDRECVARLALYQLDRKLEEFGLDQTSVPPQTSPPVNLKCFPATKPVLGSKSASDISADGADVVAPPPEPPHAEAMIAFVPDPIHTHLALWFDRKIDAIQQALQDQSSGQSGGWLYTSQWLPSDPVPYDAAEEPIDRTNLRTFGVGMETAPGVLIFRTNDFQKLGKERFLLVYLVGESPTGGSDEPGAIQQRRSGVASDRAKGSEREHSIDAAHSGAELLHIFTYAEQSPGRRTLS